MRARAAALAASAALAVAAVSTLPLPALAHEPSAAQATRSRTAAQTAAVQLQQAQAQLPAAQAELARSTAALRTAQTREQTVAAELARAQVAEQVAEQALARTRAELGRAERVASSLAREVYVQGLGSPVGQLTAALGAQNAEDFAAAVTLTRTLSRRQVDQVAHLDEQRDRMATDEARLAAARETVARARVAAQAVVEREQDLVDRASRTQQRVTLLIAQRAAAVATAEATKRQDQARYEEMATEDAALQRRLAGLAAAGPAPSVSGAGFVRPTAGRDSSPFGMRKHPITGGHKLHTGTDIAAPCGTAIRAAQAGTVDTAEYSSSYGYRTVIDHGVIGGRRVTSTYNHQEGLATNAGQTVARGQVIGQVGTTGYSTGCHLHFEILLDGEFVDPLPYL